MMSEQKLHLVKLCSEKVCDGGKHAWGNIAESPSLPPSLSLSLPPSLPPLRYGVGYHMVVVKEPQCDSSKVTTLVTSLVNGAEQVTDVGAELSYILPSTSTGSFPALFDALDGRMFVFMRMSHR